MFGNKVQFHHLAPEDAKQWMKAMKSDEFTLIDARTPEEYKAGHIKGAILIPESALLSKMDEKLFNKEKPIFIYSHDSARSEYCAQILAGAGCKKVYEFGGITDWNFDN